MSEEIREPEWYKNPDYEFAKNSIQNSIRCVAREFVSIGYYLRCIRDNEMYTEDGYRDVWEFAADLYGISRSTASRWIAINERFSKGGNSPILADGYRGYTKSQLQEMLYLTDEQAQNIPSDMTVREIREIRKPEPESEPEEQIPGQIEIQEYLEVEETVKECATSHIEEPAEPDPERPAKCIAGKSGSGYCGAAAYCAEPVQCCASCRRDCNGRCGWLDEPQEEQAEEAAIAQQENLEVTSESNVYELLKERKRLLDEWKEAYKEDEEKPSFIKKEECVIAALTMLATKEAEEEAEPAIQPVLPVMRNDNQRKAFLDTYHDWPVWFEVPEAAEVYYRYDLPDDNSSIVICEYHTYLDWKEKYGEDPEKLCRWEYLLKSGYKYLNDCKTSRTVLVEHLKEFGKQNKKTGSDQVDRNP